LTQTLKLAVRARGLLYAAAPSVGYLDFFSPWGWGYFWS